MSTAIFQYYLKYPDINWECTYCALPKVNDSFFAENIIEEINSLQHLEDGLEQDVQDEQGNRSVPDNTKLEALRKHTKKDILMCHININSLQNKCEELTNVVKGIHAHIILISETKIDSSYPNSQFAIPGFLMYN